MAAKLAYTFAEAAEATGYSIDVIRRAVRTKDLPAKYGTARPVIRHEDLVAWVDAMPDEPKRKSA